jgi:hypothetical protein
VGVGGWTWNTFTAVLGPEDFTEIASPTSSLPLPVDCCTFVQATDRVDGCDLDSSVEDGTCSPPIISSGDFNDDAQFDVIARGWDGTLCM